MFHSSLYTLGLTGGKFSLEAYANWLTQIHSFCYLQRFFFVILTGLWSIKAVTTHKDSGVRLYSVLRVALVRGWWVLVGISKIHITSKMMCFHWKKGKSDPLSYLYQWLLLFQGDSLFQSSMHQSDKEDWLYQKDGTMSWCSNIKKMHRRHKQNILSVALPPKPASATICVLLPLSDFIYNLRTSSSSCSPHGWVQTPKNSFPPLVGLFFCCPVKVKSDQIHKPIWTAQIYNIWWFCCVRKHVYTHHPPDTSKLRCASLLWDICMKTNKQTKKSAHSMSSSDTWETLWRCFCVPPRQRLNSHFGSCGILLCSGKNGTLFFHSPAACLLHGSSTCTFLLDCCTLMDGHRCILVRGVLLGRFAFRAPGLRHVRKHAGAKNKLHRGGRSLVFTFDIS